MFKISIPKPQLSFEFLKNNKQVVLSLVVVILVPALVILNSYILLSRSSTLIEKLVQTRAVSISESFNVALLAENRSETEIISRANDFIDLVDYVKKIEIYKKVNDKFVPLGENIEERKIVKTGTDEAQLFALAWYGTDPYAQKIVAENYEQINKQKEIAAGENLWAIYNPLVDQDGNVAYMTKMTVGTKDVQDYYRDLYIRTVILTIVIVLAITVMVVLNGQLFQYSILFSRLKEVDQMKDDFISIASHELRTPLTVIKGEIEMLEDDLKNKNLKPKDREEIMQSVETSSKRLDELVADILDVSRIEQGRMKFEMEKTDISLSAKEVMGDMEVMAKAKGLKLIENYPKEKAYSQLDPKRLKQILVNIIGNSVKYTTKGEIEVTIVQEAGVNKITIRDTGIGMDEKERAKLFTKFYRVQNDDTKNIIGTGLGLWITKQIIEQMGGKVMVDSIKGVGSEFTIVFPKIA